MNPNKDKIYELLTNIRETDLNRISALDSTTFIIKGWSVTLVTALIGIALQQENSTFLYLGIPVTLFFAILDFFYRKIQLSHVERVINIEKYLGFIYLRNVEQLKDILKPFYKNPTQNFIKDYFIPVCLVYLIMIIILLVLSRIPNLF